MHICQSSQVESDDFKDGRFTVCAKGNDSLELYEHKVQQGKARAIKNGHQTFYQGCSPIC